MDHFILGGLSLIPSAYVLQYRGQSGIKSTKLSAVQSSVECAMKSTLDFTVKSIVECTVQNIADYSVQCSLPGFFLILSYCGI